MSFGNLAITRLKTCASHGERAYAEYGDYRMTLIVIFLHYWVSAGQYITRFVCRSLGFNKTCVLPKAEVVCVVANYGIRYDRHNSGMDPGFQ